MKRVARELVSIAKSLVAIDFPTQDALDKYLKDHPDADRSKHRVVENKPGKSDRRRRPLIRNQRPHVKKQVNKKSLSKVQEIMDKNLLSGDENELKELAGFKRTLGQRVPEKDIGKYYVRNEQKLKKDFLANMDPSNYSSIEVFNLAKRRIQNMPTGDFGKLLAAINSDEEDEI